MSEKSLQQITEDEISFRDIIVFLLSAWKTILTFGVLGLVSSIALLQITPNLYQTVAQIQMTQIISKNSDLLGVNLEDPNILVARMKLPSIYSAKEIKACGLENTKSPAEELAKLAKFSVVKNAGTIVELTIQTKVKGQGIVCAKSLFENIRDYQNAIMKPMIEESKNLLDKFQSRLEDAETVLVRADNSGYALSAAYLANRDEVNFLTNEILRLNIFITAASTREAKLTSQIYTLDEPVLPKNKIYLAGGILCGVFLGLMFAYARKSTLSYRSNH